jgi:hypothetical protein
MLNRFFTRRFSPVWAALAAAAIVITFLSFAPVGAWAERFLGLLRVKRITAISVDTNRLRFGDEHFGRRISQLLSDSVVVTKEPGKPQTVTRAEEAGELAGFKVRLLSSRVDLSHLEVADDQAFHLTIDQARLQAILDEAGRSDLELPESLDGASIAVNIPKAVFAVYGNCSKVGPHVERRKPGDWFNCVALAQVPSPTVLTPPGLDLVQLAEVGLQLAGMSQEEARTLSQTVDWSSTLILPIPMDAASFETVEVDGVRGTLIHQRRMEDRPVGYTLLWVKKGIIYSLTGFGNPAEAVLLANSLE